MAKVDPKPGLGAGRDRSRLKTAGIQAAILTGYACLLWIWPKPATIGLCIVAAVYGAFCLADGIARRKMRARYEGMNWDAGRNGLPIRRHPRSRKRLGIKEVVVGTGKVIGGAVLFVVLLLPLLVVWGVVKGIIGIFRKPAEEREWPPSDDGDSAAVGSRLLPPPSTRRASDAKPFPS